MSKEPIKNFVPKRYSVLVKELDNLKIVDIYPKLVEKLEVDLREAGNEKLRELIASAPNDLRHAGYIYAVANEDYQRILDAYDEFLGKYEKEAQAKISQLKQEKKWAGQTNKEAIRAWIAKNVPASKVWFETIRKSRMILESCRHLYKAYENRLSSLQTYSRLIEKRRGVAPEELGKKG